MHAHERCTVNYYLPVTLIPVHSASADRPDHNTRPLKVPLPVLCLFHLDMCGTIIIYD